jgi:hypothetical protein
MAKEKFERTKLQCVVRTVMNREAGDFAYKQML